MDNDHCVAFISARRKEHPDGTPFYPLRDVAIRDNRCGAWRGRGAIATVGGQFSAPALMNVTADENVYAPANDRALVSWPSLGSLAELSEVRTKLGWEVRGRLGTVGVPRGTPSQ